MTTTAPRECGGFLMARRFDFSIESMTLGNMRELGARSLDVLCWKCHHQPVTLTDNQRAVLQMLTASTRGYSLPTLMARGFAFEMMQRLVGAGLAVVQRDAVGLSKSKVPHMRITEAGRKVIAE
jgi:hypothetical protein